MFGTLKFLNQPLPLTHPIVDCLTLQENRVTQKVHRQIWETCWMDWRQYRSGRGPAVSRDAHLHFSSDHCENFNNMHSALCRLTNQFLYSWYSEWCIYVVCSTPTSPFSRNLQLCALEIGCAIHSGIQSTNGELPLYRETLSLQWSSLTVNHLLLQTNTLHIYNMYPTVKKRYVVVWVIAHHIVKSSHGAVAVAENSLKGYCCWL